MIGTDRVLGGVVVAAGVFLLLYLIPHQVTAMPDELRDPSLFPRIAAWLLVGLGGLQILVPGPKTKLPTRRELLRLAGLLALLVAASLLLPVFGFVPTAIGLMACLALLMYERRPLWLAITILGVPPAVWALFEIVFKRPLP